MLNIFGDRLRCLRIKKKLSQAELASLLGFSNQSIVSQYESGKKQPSQQTLSKIADVFDVTVDFLIGRTDNPNPSKNHDRLGPLATFLEEAELGKLPPEALKDIRVFIEFVEQKYEKNNKKRDS